MPVASDWEPPFVIYTRAHLDLNADLAAEDDRPPAQRESAWRPGDEDDRPSKAELDADERDWR